nr:hypothetical protein CFP56_03855 [Quercus suber]
MPALSYPAFPDAMLVTRLGFWSVEACAGEISDLSWRPENVCSNRMSREDVYHTSCRSCQGRCSRWAVWPTELCTKKIGVRYSLLQQCGVTCC